MIGKRCLFVADTFFIFYKLYYYLILFFFDVDLLLPVCYVLLILNFLMD